MNKKLSDFNKIILHSHLVVALKHILNHSDYLQFHAITKMVKTYLENLDSL